MSKPETDTSTTSNRAPVTTRWAIPGVAVLAGLAYLVVGLVGDNYPLAFGGLGLMLSIAVGFVVLARYSETFAGLRDRRDERINALDAGATLFAGMVLLVAVLVMFLVEIAQGRDGMPYSALGALSGVSYVVALVWLRFRR